MYPANLPWVSTDSGAQVAVGQLGLLIVRKVKVNFEIVVFGKILQQRAITIDEGKDWATLAARRWLSEATGALWTHVEPTIPVPTQTSARPGGIGKRVKG